MCVIYWRDGKRMGQMSSFPVPPIARIWTSIHAEVISSFGAFILKAVIQRHRGHSEIIYGGRKSSGHRNNLAKTLLPPATPSLVSVQAGMGWQGGAS